jgi:hypothetical protein
MPATAAAQDENGSNTHGIRFGCHLLPYFKSNSDTNTNVIEYKYKTDGSNTDSKSDIYSVHREVDMSKFNLDDYNFRFVDNKSELN